MKKIIEAILLASVALSINYAQASELYIYGCTGNQTITGQGGMETGPMNTNVCGESQSQAATIATNYFQSVSDPFWRGVVMCYPMGSQAPINICPAPGLLGVTSFTVG